MEKAYFEYLKKRSFLAKIYRNYYLYPKIQKYCSKNFLDLGCGIGDFLSFMKSGKGIDINAYCVSYCKNLGLEVDLMKNNKIKFSNNTFDSILLDNVLEHIEDPNLLLTEIRRVIKKNSNLIIGVPGLKGYKADTDHKVFYSKEKLKNLIEKYNFIEFHSFYVPINSIFFENKLTQFCLYSIFKKKN